MAAGSQDRTYRIIQSPVTTGQKGCVLMKDSEKLPKPESSEEQHGSVPKIIRLVPQLADEQVLHFQETLYDLEKLLNRVDKAGETIGEEKLSIQVLMIIGNLLVCLCDPVVRDSTRPVPPVQQHARK